MQVRSAMRHDVRGQDKRVAASVEVAVGSTPPSSRPDSVGRAATARPTAGAVVETAQRVRFLSSNPLFAGCPALFLQTACGPSTLGAAASLVAAEETGILLTLDSRTTALAKALRKAVGECRAIVAAAAQDPGPDTRFVDANRYSGKNRAVATAAGSNLDPAWIEVQRELGLPVALTDSPYLESADHAALGSLLAEARALGQEALSRCSRCIWTGSRRTLRASCRRSTGQGRPSRSSLSTPMTHSVSKMPSQGWCICSSTPRSPWHYCAATFPLSARSPSVRAWAPSARPRACDTSTRPRSTAAGSTAS